MHTPEELAQIDADLKFWKVIENHLPWHIYGFINQYSAIFITSKGTETLSLTNEQYLDILFALEKQKNGTPKQRRAKKSAGDSES